jgi:hypothetical protein
MRQGRSRRARASHAREKVASGTRAEARETPKGGAKLASGPRRLGALGGCMRSVRHLALLALAVAAPALAQQAPVPSGTKVKLQVGQQKVLNVGLAMGLVCNDGTVVQADLRPVSDTENELVLVGLKPGKTACRAGTANLSRSVLVYVSVSAKAP